MKALKITKQFKKDLKKIQNNPQRKNNLRVVLGLLRTEGALPQKYKPHLLLGKYKGYMECHIENDYLLIWFDETSEIIKLIRLGSHSELFE